MLCSGAARGLGRGGGLTLRLGPVLPLTGAGLMTGAGLTTSLCLATRLVVAPALAAD